MDDREEISRGLAAGESCRAIATKLGCAPSTITREVNRNGGRGRHRALAADRAAWKAGLRPKVSKLAARPELREVVAQRLAQRWSPQQIAGWLRRVHPDDAEWWVSHETIYRSLFVQAKGALKHELTGYLRTGRVMRRPRGGNKTLTRPRARRCSRRAGGAFGPAPVGRTWTLTPGEGRAARW